MSNLSEQEINKMYDKKVLPENYKKANDQSKKTLKKGVDIGNQLSQTIGILFPNKIDNYVKIVRKQKYYGRYTDDCYIISNSKEELQDILKNIEKIANRYHIIINKKKTHIAKISSSFKFLQIKYFLTNTGKVIKRIESKSLKRERNKLKAYKRLLDNKIIDYETVENSFKSWLGSNWKNMSHIQIYNMNLLYISLFGRRIVWKKKKYSRLIWLMEHKSPTWN